MYIKSVEGEPKAEKDCEGIADHTWKILSKAEASTRKRQESLSRPTPVQESSRKVLRRPRPPQKHTGEGTPLLPFITFLITSSHALLEVYQMLEDC